MNLRNRNSLARPERYQQEQEAEIHRSGSNSDLNKLSQRLESVSFNPNLRSKWNTIDPTAPSTPEEPLTPPQARPAFVFRDTRPRPKPKMIEAGIPEEEKLENLYPGKFDPYRPVGLKDDGINTPGGNVSGPAKPLAFKDVSNGMKLVIVREFSRQMMFEEIVKFFGMDEADLVNYIDLAETEYLRFVDDHVRIGVCEAEQMKLIERGTYTDEEWQKTIDDMADDGKDPSPLLSHSIKDVHKARRFLKSLRFREEFPFHNPKHTPAHVFNDFDEYPSYRLWREIIHELPGYVGTQYSISDLGFTPSDLATYYENQLEYVKKLYPHLYYDEDVNGKLRYGVRNQPVPYYMPFESAMIEPEVPRPTFGSMASGSITNQKVSFTEEEISPPQDSEQGSQEKSIPDVLQPDSEPVVIEDQPVGRDRVSAPPKHQSQIENSAARKMKKHAARNTNEKKANMQPSSLRHVTSADDMNGMSSAASAKAGIFTEDLLLQTEKMQSKTSRDLSVDYVNKFYAPPATKASQEKGPMNPPPIPPHVAKRKAEKVSFDFSKKANTKATGSSQLTGTSRSTGSMGPPPIPSQTTKRKADNSPFVPSKKASTKGAVSGQLTGTSGSTESTSQEKKKTTTLKIKRPDPKLAKPSQSLPKSNNGAITGKPSAMSSSAGSSGRPSVPARNPKHPASFLDNANSTIKRSFEVASAASATSTAQQKPSGSQAPTAMKKGDTSTTPQKHSGSKAPTSMKKGDTASTILQKPSGSEVPTPMKKGEATSITLQESSGSQADAQAPSAMKLGDAVSTTLQKPSSPDVPTSTPSTHVTETSDDNSSTLKANISPQTATTE